jgi:ATP-dependent Lhr-like helicase
MPPEAGAKPLAVTLAATDPANPYGAALPWPEREAGHRPGRKAGALVVLVDGALGLYVERGGKTLLTFPPTTTRRTADEVLAASIESLGTAVRRGALGRLTVERADGSSVLGEESEAVRRALEDAGFVVTPRGLRLRG